MRWFRSILLGLIVVLVTVSGLALAQAGDKVTAPAALSAPPISPYIPIEEVPLENLAPSVASGRSEYLVVWEEHVHGGEVGIIGRFVSSKAIPAGPPFPLVQAANVQFYRPAVAYNTRHGYYLVVYEYQYSSSDTDLLAITVSGDGMLGTPMQIDVDNDKDWYPDVTYNERDDEFLIVYEKYISATRRDIEAQRVRGDLSLASWRNIAGAANQLRRLPDVAYNSARDEYLIAYTLNSPPTAGGDIIGRISSSNLGTLSSEIQITPLGTSPSQDGVSVAAGYDEYLVVWNEENSATTESIWGRRVAGNGTLQPFISLAHDTDEMRVEPAVAFGDAGRYMVFWRYISSTASAWDIYGRTVIGGQNQPDGPEFPIDTTSGMQRSPAVGCSPTGPCLVAYEDNWPGVVGDDDYNIRGRLAGHHRAFLPFGVRNQ